MWEAREGLDVTDIVLGQVDVLQVLILVDITVAILSFEVLNWLLEHWLVSS